MTVSSVRRPSTLAGWLAGECGPHGGSGPERDLFQQYVDGVTADRFVSSAVADGATLSPSFDTLRVEVHCLDRFPAHDRRCQH